MAEAMGGIVCTNPLHINPPMPPKRILRRSRYCSPRALMYRQFDTEKCQFDTKKCQFETEKCQFETEKCQFELVTQPGLCDSAHSATCEPAAQGRAQCTVRCIWVSIGWPPNSAR